MTNWMDFLQNPVSSGPMFDNSGFGEAIGGSIFGNAETTTSPLRTEVFNADPTLADMLSNLSSGQYTGEDVIQAFGVTDQGEIGRSGAQVQGLIDLATTALGKLPGLETTLLGQSRDVFGQGRQSLTSDVGSMFKQITSQAAGSGFAKAGTFGRAREAVSKFGREASSSLFQGLQGDVFDVGQRIDRLKGDITGSLSASVSNILNALVSGQVEFGGDDTSQSRTRTRAW